MEELKFEESTMSSESASDILGSGEQIALTSGECTLSGLGKQTFQAGTTTANDLPDHILESILERLPLLKYHLHRYSLGTGWVSLMSPSLRRTCPLPRPWFFRGIKTCPPQSPFSLDGQTSKLTNKCPDLSLCFAEPESGKEEKIHLCLGGTCLASLNSVYIDREIRASSGGFIALVAGKGLLFLSAWLSIWSETTSVMPLLYVLNPVNGSKRILPSIPAYKHVTSKSSWILAWIPLKLVVDLDQKVGLKSGDLESSSYKCYLLEKMLEMERNGSDLRVSISFRIIVYDSRLNSWALPGIVGAEHKTIPYVHNIWRDTYTAQALRSFYNSYSSAQVFPMEDGSICISKGSSEMHLAVYHNCALVGTVSDPYVIKAEDCNCGCSRLENCGCMSTAMFQSEGKLVFFKQTSWQGPFGPNCISVTLWELNMKAMAWEKQLTLPTHRFEVCLPPHSDEEIRRLNPSALPIIFRYEGMLVVVLSHLRLIAALDISNKSWCKVPQTLLETDWYCKASLRGENRYDVDRLLFQPSCHARA